MKTSDCPFVNDIQSVAVVVSVQYFARLPLDSPSSSKSSPFSFAFSVLPSPMPSSLMMPIMYPTKNNENISSALPTTR